MTRLHHGDGALEFVCRVTPASADVAGDPGLVLDCGHTESPHLPITRGYATLPDGARLCYTCAEARERADMATAERWTAYLSSDGKRLTAWPGWTLATVTDETVRRVGFGGSRTYVRAVDATGKRWHGTGPGRGMYVNLRATKGRAP